MTVSPLSPSLDLTHERALLQKLCTQAGDCGLKYFRSKPEKITKPDGSPVSVADLEIDDLLRTGVSDAFPEDGWLSEETADDRERLTKSRVWIADPIDGTRAFLEGWDEWSISIALTVDKTPVLAVVYAPATGEWFQAELQKGASCNGNIISCTPHPHIEGATIYGPRSLPNPDKWPTPWPPVKMQWANSIAYRMARVASGHVDAAVSITPKSEWDLVAAHLIVSEAGGHAATHLNEPLTYNNADTRVSGIVAAGPNLFKPLINRTQQLRTPSG